MAPRSDLKEEMAAFEGMRQDLEAQHMGQWVLFHQHDLIGVYDTFENAANDAVARFGRGPYLIRQIGAPPITLPASVMYCPDYAKR